VAALREEGPTLGRPLVDRLKATKIHHLKELRPGSRGRSEIRIIFAFDPTRSALLLLGGDKAGKRLRVTPAFSLRRRRPDRFTRQAKVFLKFPGGRPEPFPVGLS